MAAARVLHFEESSVHIPSWVIDLPSFRHWVDSDEFPDEGRICYLNGGVWLDMSKQQLFSHVRVKDELTIVVGGMIREDRRGFFFSDGCRLSNSEADISVVPDCLFVSESRIRSGQARFQKRSRGGYTEIEGAPDLVVEIVSANSLDKDTEWLMSGYWNAGIQEYWLIDARKAPFRFDVLRRGSREFNPIRKVGGWVKSPVLAAAFRLSPRSDNHGYPDCKLEMR